MSSEIGAQTYSTQAQDRSSIGQVELLVSEISISQPEQTSLREKHDGAISTLADTLNQLLLSRPKKPQAGLQSPELNESANTNSSSSQITQDLPVNLRMHVPIERSTAGFGSQMMPYQQSGFDLHSMMPGVQSRLFMNPSSSHLNYPVIPRWSDRARLRRMQTESPAIFPNDLPPWSVRSKVPTVPQPDWTEDGQYLLYDGFSLKLVQAYETALGANKVSQVPIPYDDEDMKRALVEAGVFSEQAAQNLIAKNGRESWRGPTEGKEDEKHREEMRKIMERDWED